MRTILLGSDFMYDIDGNLKIIETNTAIGYHRNKYESDENCFDLTNLTNFITSNNFTKVVYIGEIEVLNQKFSSLCNSLSIQYEYLLVDKSSITVPYVEDTTETLIIRSAYDTTAIVDDLYCKDNLEFMKLIKNESYGSQFAYKDDEGNLISNITTINDNGNNPNFILKSRFPNYDKKIYPKFYKVSNQTELDSILQNVNQQYFLMEFFYNEDKTFENHIKVIRSLNLLFPPNLESIKIGGYTTFCNGDLTIPNTYNPDTFELEEHRFKYLSFDSGFVKPKLLDTDLVKLHDGTWKTANDLQVGDILQTINIPNPFNYNNMNEQVNYKIDYDTFLSGVSFDTNPVILKERRNIWSNVVKITFTDESIWEDTQGSVYLSYRNNEIRFLSLNLEMNEESRVKVGDEIVLIDGDSQEVNFVKKTIQSLETTWKFFGGWVIGVQDDRIFLSKSEQNNTQYASIEHNVGCSAFGCYSAFPCPKSVPQCCGPWNICVTNCAFCPQL